MSMKFIYLKDAAAGSHTMHMWFSGTIIKHLPNCQEVLLPSPTHWGGLYWHSRAAYSHQLHLQPPEHSHG